MPNVGVAELVAVLAVLAVTIAIPVTIIAIVIRFAPVGREDPRKVLGDRLHRGEITSDQYESALRALGL